MKTLREIYNPPAATAAEIYRWSETLKFGQWQTLAHRCGSIAFARETPGMISASSGPSGLMARIRLKRPGATVGWVGPPPPAVVPCEPEIEGAEMDNQREQMEALLSHVRGEVRQWLFAGEWQAIVEGRKEVKAEVSELRRKAKVLGKVHGVSFRERAKALARFATVIEVSGFRLAVFPERGHWHVIEFHTGQGFACPSSSSKAFPGNKRGLMEAVRNAAAKRIAEVGRAELIEILSQSKVLNQSGAEAVS